jgi:hypothetical protein
MPIRLRRTVRTSSLREISRLVSDMPAPGSAATIAPDNDRPGPPASRCGGQQGLGLHQGARFAEPGQSS